MEAPEASSPLTLPGAVPENTQRESHTHTDTHAQTHAATPAETHAPADAPSDAPTASDIPAGVGAHTPTAAGGDPSIAPPGGAAPSRVGVRVRVWSGTDTGEEGGSSRASSPSPWARSRSGTETLSPRATASPGGTGRGVLDRRRSHRASSVASGAYRHERIDDEFTDDQIRDAFAELDLDKNGFLSVAELRHMLMCLGELVTDEEVEGMLRMCDTDGDGQVSFKEFRTMARSHDPTKMAPPTDSENEDPQDSAEARARRKQQLAEERAVQAQRMQACEAFVHAHVIQPLHLNRAFQRVREHPNYNENEGVLPVPAIATVFEVPEEDEALKRIVTAFEVDGSIDSREVILSLSSVCTTHPEQRINLAFEMYDADGSGTLEIEELAAILKATYLSADAEACTRRARMLLTSGAITDEAPHLTLDEFAALAKRFPNAIFPRVKSVVEASRSNRSASVPAAAGSPPRSPMVLSSQAGMPAGARLPLMSRSSVVSRRSAW